MYLDVKRLKSPKDLARKKPVRKHKDEPIYDKIKRFAGSRFGAKSLNAIKYVDLGSKYILGPPDLRMSFDLLMKSDCRCFGMIIADFIHLETIVLWSELVNQSMLDRRDKMVKVPARIKEEFERTKISQNV